MQQPNSQPSHPTNPTQGSFQATNGAIRTETANDIQLLHRLDTMQMEQKINHMDLKHTQEINNMRQTYMLDKVISMHSTAVCYQPPSMFSPPVYAQPLMQYTYPGIQPTRQPAWWGTAANTVAPPAYQQLYGQHIPGRAVPSTHVNRFIPNPAPNPAHTLPKHNLPVQEQGKARSQHSASDRQPEAQAQQSHAPKLKQDPPQQQPKQQQQSTHAKPQPMNSSRLQTHVKFVLGMLIS